MNLLAGLGRPADHARRRAEAQEAARRLGIELLVHDPPLALSLGDDRAAAGRVLAGTLRRLVAERAAGLVVAPGPHDGHHGHEAVGRAVLDALEALGDGAARWWMWGLWAELPHPTLLVPFGDARLAEVEHALAAHAGELARNRYGELVRGRALANAVLGPERAFGFGHPGSAAEPYAELLTELVHADGRWTAAAPRRLDAREPVPEHVEPGEDLGWWLREASFGDRMRAACPAAARTTRRQ